MTLQSSGAIYLSQINAEFGRGLDLNSYRGTVWWTDAGSTGNFSSGSIYINEFYGKRLTQPVAPVVPGAQEFYSPGTFVIPPFNQLTVRCDGSKGSDANGLIYCGGGVFTGGAGGLAIKQWFAGGLTVGASYSVLVGGFVNSTAMGVTGFRGVDASAGAGFGGGGCCGGGVCTLTPSNGGYGSASGGDTNIAGGSAYTVGRVRFDWS